MVDQTVKRKRCPNGQRKKYIYTEQDIKLVKKDHPGYNHQKIQEELFNRYRYRELMKRR